MSPLFYSDVSSLHLFCVVWAVSLLKELDFHNYTVEGESTRCNNAGLHKSSEGVCGRTPYRGHSCPGDG